MKIGQPSTDSQTKWGWLLALVCVFVIGFFLGSENVWAPAQRQLDALAERLQGQADPVASIPTLVVDMPFENYNQLLDRREATLQTGVYIPANRDFMTATLRLDDQAVPANLRFYPGPADHLQGPDRWNWDVRTRQDQQLLGMQRFYLLDPADNHWLYQWAFARSLQREDLLAAQYQFVNLVFNGDDWGVYGLLEGFGDELMTANGRTAGVILEFDADLLWESTAHFGDAQYAYADPVSNLLATDFRYFEIDPFRDAAIDQDPLRSDQKDAGISRLRELQTGQLAAAQVFDVEKYGRFLALVDLWGANEAVSLVNLRYYYNPDTNLLEPVGFVGNPLADQQRLPIDATYFDWQLQAAYAREAQRLSQPDYLVALQSELGDELQNLQSALRPQLGDLVLPWEDLQTRQAQMRASLDPVQPVFAQLGPPSLSMSATIQIDLASVVNLPLEIIGFDINSTTFLEADPAWLQTPPADDLLIVEPDRIILPAGERQVIRYVRFHLPTTEIIRLDKETDFMTPIEINIATRIVGLDHHQMTRVREYSEDRLLP